MSQEFNKQRDNNQRDSIHSRNYGNDRWNGYAPKDLSEDFGQGQVDNTRSIFALLSEIQRYYVIEERTEELPKEYFTIEQILEYFKVGFKSGLLESFIFVTLVPFLQIIYPSFKFYFLNSEVTDNVILILDLMSYTPIVLSTLFMLYIGKYYQGPITRRSIFMLMNGRSFSFILKGILFYFFIQWFVGYSLGNPYILYVIADYTSWVVDIFADINAGTEGLYKYYYTYVVPALRDTASNIVWTMMLFAISPYFIIFFKSYVIRVKKQKIKEEYENY